MKMLKTKVSGGYIKKYFCNVCYYKKKFPLYDIFREFTQDCNTKKFNVTYLDNKIKKDSDNIYNENFDKFNNFKHKYGFFASELYKTGGHTPCLVNLATSLAEKQQNPLFLSRLNTCYKNAPDIMNTLELTCNVYGISNYELKDLYNQIIENCPEIAFVYIHPDDVVFASVMYLLKKHTPIKLIYFNHSSHFPNLGMNFVDLILEGMPATQNITKEKRKLSITTKIIGLQSIGANETKYCDGKEIENKRRELGVDKNELLTVSGGTSYKFFDEKASKYFEMIKELLVEKQNLKHLIITNLSDKQKEIVDKILKNEKEAYSRLIFHKITPDFELLFQCADVFIDSFPVSSALTQVDLMRLKVASVVKINKDVPELSFHEYQMENYPYMFEDIQDMKNGIIELLDDEQKRKETIAKNYDFWLKNYEKKVVKDKYLRIVEEVKNA